VPTRSAALGAYGNSLEMTDLEKVHRDYRAAFLRYLSRREEAALRVGSELGRSDVSEGLSILDLVQVHHEVFLEVLAGTRGEDLTLVSTAASEFLGGA